MTQGIPATVAVRKHPIHPALVGFPITFLSAAPVTDLLFWWTGNPLWAEFSFWLILSGMVTGALALLTGLIDFLTIERARAAAAGWTHFLLADAAIFLSTFNLVGRLEDRQGSILFTGLALSAIAAGMLLAAGYFGATLIYRHRIGVYGSEEELHGHR